VADFLSAIFFYRLNWKARRCFVISYSKVPEQVARLALSIIRHVGMLMQNALLSTADWPIPAPSVPNQTVSCLETGSR
jgi:hypothetical protein